MALLEVKNLHTYFKTKKGTVKAVNDVSYSLEAGKTIGIVGESGSGKSVSAMSILRLLDDNGYIAEGEILPVHTGSFGGIGIFAIPEMGRFYRHVLVQKRYPHHGAVAFGHYGKLLFEVFKFLGVGDIAYNQPKSLPYPTENPFA